MFARTTIFIAVLSAIGIALALLAQATHFSREALLLAALLLAVALFIGLTTFVRCVAINYEDAHWVNGLHLLRSAYLRINPELEPFLETAHMQEADDQSLAHGSRQRRENFVRSLTTTSSVVATLNSLLTGALAGDVVALVNGGIREAAIVGGVVSVASGVLHVRHAARFREKQRPPTEPPLRSPTVDRSGEEGHPD